MNLNQDRQGGGYGGGDSTGQDTGYGGGQSTGGSGADQGYGGGQDTGYGGQSTNTGYGGQNTDSGGAQGGDSTGYGGNTDSGYGGDSTGTQVHLLQQGLGKSCLAQRPGTPAQEAVPAAMNARLHAIV